MERIASSTRSKSKKPKRSPISLRKSTERARSRCTTKRDCTPRQSKTKVNLKDPNRQPRGCSTSLNINEKSNYQNEKGRPKKRQARKTSMPLDLKMSKSQSKSPVKGAQRRLKDHANTKKPPVRQKRSQRLKERVIFEATEIQRSQVSSSRRRQLNDQKEGRKTNVSEDRVVKKRRGVCKKEDSREKETVKPKVVKERARIKREQSEETDEDGDQFKENKTDRHIVSKATAKSLRKKVKKEKSELEDLAALAGLEEFAEIENFTGLTSLTEFMSLKGLLDAIKGVHAVETKLGQLLRVVGEQRRSDDGILDKSERVKHNKRSRDGPEKEFLEQTQKKIKNCQNPSRRAELKNEDRTNTVTLEETFEDVMKEEGNKGLENSIIVEGRLSKEELIAYYEEKLRKLKESPTQKMSKLEIQTTNFLDHKIVQQHSESQMEFQEDEPKTEDQEDETKLIPQKVLPILNNEKAIIMSTESQQNDSQPLYLNSEEKIEEDEGRNMVTWEQERTASQGIPRAEYFKILGQQDNMELLKNLFSDLEQPKNSDDHLGEKLMEETEEKIEEEAEVLEQEGEHASTKTEPKVEEKEQMNEERVLSDQRKEVKPNSEQIVSHLFDSSEDDGLPRDQEKSEGEGKAKNESWSEDVSVKEECDQQLLRVSS